jgi:hypothetical protein
MFCLEEGPVKGETVGIRVVGEMVGGRKGGYSLGTTALEGDKVGIRI